MTLHVMRDGANVTVYLAYGPVTAEVTETREHALSFWHELGRYVVEDTEDRAKAGYERFHAVIGGPAEPWESLAQAHRDAWTAAFTELRNRLMASLSDIRTALGARIAAGTGLRVLPEARDQISPPVAVILPGQPLVVYGQTMDGAFTVNLRVLLAISDAPPNEKVQRALDAYLGIGAGTGSSSIAGAIREDPTLGGAVHFAEPISVSSYGRILYNDLTYFGARLEIQLGTI